MLKNALVLSAGLCITPLLYAEIDTRFSGFGTFSAITSDSDLYGYRPDISYDGGVFGGDIDLKAGSILGGQLDLDITSNLHITGQAVYRDKAGSNLDDYVSQLFIKYAVTPAFSVRFGRTPLDLFTLTEYRDISYAYIWAAAPIEVYGLVPNRVLDGLDLSYTHRFQASTLTAKLYTGRSDAQVATNGEVDDIAFDNIAGLSLEWGELDWNIKFKHSIAGIVKNPSNTELFLAAVNQVPDFIWPGAMQFADDYSFKSKDIQYTSVSAYKSIGEWAFSGEFSSVTSDLASVEKIQGAYLGVSYRMDKITWYGLYGVARSNSYTFNENFTVDPNSDPVLAQLAQTITVAMNAFSPNQKSLALGARYDLTDSVALKFQWSKTVIDEWGGTLWYTSSPVKDSADVNTVMAVLSFIF